MSAERELADILFRMEEDVVAAVRLADAIVFIGEAGSSVPADVVFAVGEALAARASAVKQGWERAFELSRPSAS